MKKMLLMVSILIGFIGCKKEEIEYEPASFSVACNNCTISYDNTGDKANETVTSTFKKDLKHTSNANITVSSKGTTTFRFF